MKFEDFIVWAFCGLLGFCGLSITTIMGLTYVALKDLSAQMLVVVTRVDSHETRITKIEDVF